MSGLPDLLAPLIGHQPGLVFSVLLVVHVFAGLTCVATGAAAALSPKRRGRHPILGRIYFLALGIVFVSSTAMSLMRWPEDAYLFVLGTIAFGSASIGFTARRRRWPGWTTAHVAGMGVSYMVLLTAFYVDNGPRLPIWKELPPAAFWILPSAIGTPIIGRALARHTRVQRDIRALLQTPRALAAGSFAARGSTRS
jgi:hypothetical protein